MIKFTIVLPEYKSAADIVKDESSNLPIRLLYEQLVFFGSNVKLKGGEFNYEIIEEKNKRW